MKHNIAKYIEELRANNLPNRFSDNKIFSKNSLKLALQFINTPKLSYIYLPNAIYCGFNEIIFSTNKIIKKYKKDDLEVVEIKKIPNSILSHWEKAFNVKFLPHFEDVCAWFVIWGDKPEECYGSLGDGSATQK